MKTGWHCVLWLCAAVSLARSLDQDGWIGEELDLYNQREDGEFYFKMLSDLPASHLEEEQNFPTITFLIKETDCPKSQRVKLEECDYKKNGDVKICGLYPGEAETSEAPKCVSLTKDFRTKRATGKKRCRDYTCKLKVRQGYIT
ncbi:cathelicidin-6-like [Mantella aurantiaca]